MDYIKLKEKLVKQLYEIGAIKFGEFTLSSGKSSPVYIDLRIIVSYPEALRNAIRAYETILEEKRIEPMLIVGVAVGGLPIASILSYKLNKPMVYVREKEKKHGTKKMIEGVIRYRENIVIIDDVATTGNSILKANNALRTEGASSKNALVLVDREQGAKEALKKENIELHSFLKISEMMDILKKSDLIDEGTYRKVLTYIKAGDGLDE